MALFLLSIYAGLDGPYKSISSTQRKSFFRFIQYGGTRYE